MIAIYAADLDDRGFAHIRIARELDEADRADEALGWADASITSRPGDALAIYLKAIGSLKGMTGDNAYRQIAALLLSARACHDALGTADEFKRYLVLFRMEQKRKRNLMKILDQNGL